MQKTETPEEKFRGVLDQLMSGYEASAEELSVTLAYLFGLQPTPLFFKDKELFESIEYLRETVVSHGLADLDALTGHFEDRKREMRKYMMQIVASDDNLVEDIITAADESLQLRVADTLSITQPEFDQLSTQITTDAGRSFEQFYTRVLQYFESTPLPAAGERNPHSVVKRHVRELVTANKPESMEWQSMQTMLPAVLKYYVEQFASHLNGAGLMIMQFGKFSAGKSTLHSNFSNYACELHGMNTTPFYGSQLPDYASIMEVVKREEPITDRNFKVQLTQWLVYSKLIISDCQHEEIKLMRIDVSLKHIFQCAPVRVYGMRNLQYWIQNLFETRLSLKKWVILKRRPGHFWLTSDNPGFLINLNELQCDFTEVVARHSLLDIRPDSVLYYPLSKEYCLKLEPPVEVREINRRDMPIDFRMPSDDEQEFVNGVTVSTHRKVVITNQRQTLKEIQL